MLDSTVRWSAPVSDGLLPIRTLKYDRYAESIRDVHAKVR